MNELHVTKIALEMNLTPRQVMATADLLEEDATVPFIARYRKEVTGSLDEVQIAAIRDRMIQLMELDTRREAILKSLVERDLLTEELRDKIAAAETMTQLEDIYLPYRPKRRTRATVAKERGLEPLAELLWTQGDIDPTAEAAPFVSAEKEVPTVQDALAGARDILAERISEDQTAREKMRELFWQKGLMIAKVIEEKKEEGVKFKDYYDVSVPVATTPSHRVLAMLRGESEEVLTLRIAPPEEDALPILTAMFVKADNAAAAQVKLAVEDGYKRLLLPSMETETRVEAKKRADEVAIRVFAENLRELLMSPPLGQKNVLAIDPGFRTGCKVACLDRQGKLLHHEVIFPERPEASLAVQALCQSFAIEAIAIGNGTASRETHAFVATLGLPPETLVVMVNESGASVYSASAVAREEFPDHDVTVRGAVSIGRRLMDPLAELVKIDPKSIGVGQYQHDVDQTNLKRSLDDIVVSCVNQVGVEVNTSSKQLLTYVSGLGPQLAGNIVAYRDEHGAFKSRADLKNVPRLGPKAFEQAAGFLRIRDAENPLDASAVHPESYAIVDRMAADLGCSIKELVTNEEQRKKIDLKKYVTNTVGLPTLTDILAELAKPGRDPREKFEAFQFAEGVSKMEDIKPGMKLPGVVTNVTAFGAFVDIGVHQDGLVHISQLADRFVKDPAEVVKVHQRVMVTVVEVDLPRKRIALSMRSDPEKAPPPKSTEPQSQPPRRPPQDRSRPLLGKKPTPRFASGWFSQALEQAKKTKK